MTVPESELLVGSLNPVRRDGIFFTSAWCPCSILFMVRVVDKSTGEWDGLTFATKDALYLYLLVCLHDNITDTYIPTLDDLVENLELQLVQT